MLFEDYKFKLYTSEEVNLMSFLEIEEYKLHVYTKGRYGRKDLVV